MIELIASAVALVFIIFSLVLYVRLKLLQQGHAATACDYVALQAQQKVTEEQKQTLTTDCQMLRSDYTKAIEQQRAVEATLSLLRSDYEEILQKHAALTAQFESEKRHLAIQSDWVESNRKILSQQFEQLSQNIFDKKDQIMEKKNEQLLYQVLKPFREQIDQFRARTEQIYDTDIRDRQSLRNELDHLKTLNLKMSQDAVNLTKALRNDHKTQGRWGEMILERILENSGLRKGDEYQVQQVNYQTETGKRLIPDVIVHLPNKKDVVIDSKVSLTAYDRYCAETAVEGREQALKEHLRSLQRHMSQLNWKAYEHLENIQSLDFVLLFIPVEPAFQLAVELSPELYSTAYEKNIILVSPSTLMAALRTVQNLWRYERQNKHVEAIANQAGKLHDQAVLVIESLISLGKTLDKAQSEYTDTVKRLHTGRGNLVQRVKQLAELGARTKRTIPAQLLHDVQNQDE